MKLKTISIAALAALGVGASAQSIMPTPLGTMIRFGIFKPSSGAGGASGDSWFTGGVEVDAFKLGVGPLRSRITFSVDTYSKSGASSVPILANYVAQVDRIRYSAGAGISIADVPDADSGVRFAYQISAGYDLPWAGLPLTAELRFFGVQGVGTALDGFALTLGFRI
ncbi:MAG TPA: hypothetical protein VFG65_07625 [Fimbriimonadales bacterium]|jgi:hypothetical protein|nr:hypothetical protein [Fimbriimonadales bacterium]